MIQVLLTWLLWPILWIGLRRASPVPRRILVIQTAKIGDAICTSPLLRELRAGFPVAHIAMLVGPAASPLLENNPHIDELSVIGVRDWQGVTGKLNLAFRLRRQRFDTVICCNGGVVWPMVTLWAGIPARIGVLPNFAGYSQRIAGCLWSAGIAHHGDRLIVSTYFDMLRILGLSPVRSDKEVFTAPGAEKRIAVLPLGNAPLIGIAVSAANKLKELDGDALVSVAKGLLDSVPNCRVVLLGTATDTSRATFVMESLDMSYRYRVADTCGSIALGDLPALLSRLKVFVGVDSGLTYMADALGIPIVSVAGPCNMVETRPVNPQVRIIQKSLPCLPCAHIFRAPTTCRIGTRACITEVQAVEIVDAACRLLEAGPE